MVTWVAFDFLSAMTYVRFHVLDADPSSISQFVPESSSIIDVS